MMPDPIPGAIASEHGSAAHLGAATMARGGNAVDCAITTTLAVHLLCPYHSCVGGSGFALVRQPSSSGSEYSYVDFRGTAPKAITQEYIHYKDTMVGGNSVIVPGEIKGLKALHERFGKLAWKECIAPVVRLAREGIPMGKDLYDVSTPIMLGSWVDLEDNHPYSRQGDGQRRVRREHWSQAASCAGTDPHIRKHDNTGTRAPRAPCALMSSLQGGPVPSAFVVVNVSVISRSLEGVKADHSLRKA